MRQLNAVLVDKNEFPPETKWVRNNHLPGGTNHLNLGTTRYETTVGTNQLVSQKLKVAAEWLIKTYLV